MSGNDPSTNDCWYQSDLGGLVLECMDLDSNADEIYNFYQDLIDKHAGNIEADNESVIEEAFEVYMQLLAKRQHK